MIYILISCIVLYYNFFVRQIIKIYYYKGCLSIIFFAKYLILLSENGIDLKIKY